MTRVEIISRHQVEMIDVTREVRRAISASSMAARISMSASTINIRVNRPCGGASRPRSCANWSAPFRNYRCIVYAIAN